MLSDRNYMRDDYPREGTSALVWLISSLVAMFVLQHVFLRLIPGADGLLENFFALSVANLKAWKLWTLFTYGFLHSTRNILLIFVNLVCLFFMARALEPVLGSRRYLGVFGFAVVLGGLLWTATNWRYDGEIIGAWPGVVGLFTVFACFYPNQPMTILLFFVMPVTLKPKYVAFIWLGINLLGFTYYELFRAASPFGEVSYSAQLGGMAAGWIYYRYLHEANWSFGAGKSEIELPHWLKKAPKTPKPAAYQVDVSRPHDLRAEVDRILDKINSH